MVRLTLFAMVLSAGAFGLSLLVVEWRQESTDAGTPVRPSPTPSPEEVVVRAEFGAEVEWRGLRLTVEDIERTTVSGGSQVTVVFAVENVDAQPETMADIDYKAVDAEGFSCSPVNAFPRGLQPGEKVRADAPFFCNGPIKTLRVDGIRFEFPQP